MIMTMWPESNKGRSLEEYTVEAQILERKYIEKN